MTLTSRTSTVRLFPPRFARGISGRANALIAFGAQASSVRSLE
jgi:hypothetical protein